MADWVTISSLATAGGTLVLAGATFSAVRSAHASTRVTERALLASIRPLLVPTRLEDPMEKIGFLDENGSGPRAGGDQGFWQGALRDPDEPAFAAMPDAIEKRQRVSIDVLCGDHEGGQRTVTRFGLWPAGDDSWLTTTTRHWNLDGSGFRDGD